MNILLVSNLYPPQELGGYGRSMADFAWGLLERGHRLRVLSSDAPYLGPSAPGPCGEAVNRGLQLKGNFEKGVQLLRDPHQCAVVDQHNQAVLQAELVTAPTDALLLGNLDLLGPELLEALLAAGLPLLHHVGFVAPPYGAWQWPQAPHYTLVAASRAVRQSLLESGLPVAQAPVVYPGARTDIMAPARLPTRMAAFRPPLGTASNPLKLCFAGLLMASKGAHTVVEAAAQLHHQGVSVQVNLAGSQFEPGYWERLEAFSRTAGLAGLVQWVGPLQRPQLARFFSLHQVGVFPSIYPEAFGIVAAEMQACGLALLSSGVGGAAELVEDGRSGLLFRPGDGSHLAQQLLRLVHEPGLLQRLRAAGMERVSQLFSVKKAAQQLEQLWNAPYPQPSGLATRDAICGSMTF
jgi:glycogen(starch) synthase